MDSDHSSSLAQQVHENIVEQEIPPTHHDSPKTNGHADTNLKKISKDLKQGSMKIESSPEGGEEKTEEGSASQTDGEDGPQDVPVNHERFNVSFFPLTSHIHLNIMRPRETLRLLIL
jgi:hypothetical protein